MIRSLLTAAAFSAICATSVAQQANDGSDMLQLEGIASIVNDEPISLFDIRQRAAMLIVTLGVQPTPEVFSQLASTAREQLIDETLQLQMAKEFELVISDEEIERAIARIASQAGSDMATLEQQFAGVGISMNTLREQVRADIAWRRIMSGRFGSRIRVSRTAIEDQMDRLRAQSQNTSYQLAEIFLFAPDEESKVQALTAANSLITQLREGVPFQNAAQQFSSAPTASTGGDMGWVALDDLAPPLAEAVSSATNAGILEPIVADNGVYILSLRARRDPQEVTSNLSLKQFVATNNDVELLEASMARVESCDDMEAIADNEENILLVDLGDVKLTDLGAEAQDLVSDLNVGQSSPSFEISRGWASLFVCDRDDGIENMPTTDQIEDQLFGREFNMISERELRNSRLEATILNLQ